MQFCHRQMYCSSKDLSQVRQVPPFLFASSSPKNSSFIISSKALIDQPLSGNYMCYLSNCMVNTFRFLSFGNWPWVFEEIKKTLRHPRSCLIFYLLAIVHCGKFTWNWGFTSWCKPCLVICPIVGDIMLACWNWTCECYTVHPGVSLKTLSQHPIAWNHPSQG